MNLSLSKIKIHPDMSQETNCFSATICLDGKPVGTVRNAGHGGCNFYDWTDREQGQKIQEWAKTQNTEFQFEQLDQVIDQLLAKGEENRQLKKWCKKQTVFRLKGDEKDKWRILKAPFDAKVKAQLVAKCGDKIERIANEEIT